MRRLAIAVATGVVAVGGFTAVAYAAIPDTQGVIHGCYNTNNGDLRVVNDPSSCRNGETSLTWNQTGPQGAAGPQGAPSAQSPSSGSSSHAFSISPGPVGVPAGWTAVPVAVDRMTVPAGNYVVWATGQANQVTGSDDYATCTLVGNGTIATQAMRPNSDTVADYALTGVTSLSSGGTIELDCVGSSSATLGPVLRNNTLVAMQVDGLN